MKKVVNKGENLIHCFETLSHGGVVLTRLINKAERYD